MAYLTVGCSSHQKNAGEKDEVEPGRERDNYDNGTKHVDAVTRLPVAAAHLPTSAADYSLVQWFQCLRFSLQ